MSWQQWPQVTQPSVTPVLNTSNPVLNPAPAVAPPGLQYTPEQWAQLQQQNWNQWAQWQQQYQQWHQQYGAEYQKSMNALAQAAQQPMPGLPNVAVPPPLPIEPKPPLPADDPPPPVPSYTTAPPPPQQGYNTAPPPAPAPVPPAVPKPSEQRPPVHYNSYNTFNTRNPPPNQNQNWQNQNQNYRYDQNKRPFDQAVDRDAKRPALAKPGWQNPQPQTQPPPQPRPKENVEELSEAEKKFDKQFAEWESQFQKWKEQNAEHPDKEQYKEYEKKWESWRAQLLERREQMKRKRLGLPINPPSQNKQPNQSFNSPQQNFTQAPPTQQNFSQAPPFQGQSFSQPPPKQSPKPPVVGGAQGTPPFTKPPPTLNDEPLKFKDSKPSVQPVEDTGDFIKPNTGGGIPGLDLVKDDPKLPPKENEDVVVLDPEEKEKEKKQKGPDFDAISKGINTILGDQKLLNMLSMVSQTPVAKQPDKLTNTVSRIKDSFDSNSQVPYPEQSNLSYEEHSNHSGSYGPREFVNNFDDQTRSSFTMAHNEHETRFEGHGNFNRGPNQFPERFGNEQNRGDRFAPGPRHDKFGPKDDRFGFNQERFASNPDRFGPGSSRFGPGEDRFGPGQDRFGPGQDRFGPGQDKFGPNQDRHGPGQDRFGLNQDRLGSGKDRFGPNQDRFGPGPDKFAPNEDRSGFKQDKFPPNHDRPGPIQERPGANQEKFGPNQDRFGPKQDKFRPNQDRFTPNQEKFGLNQDRFGPNQDKFGPNEGRFGSNQDRFGPHQDRFGPNQSRGGPNQDRFGPNQDRFGPNNDRFGPNQDRFGPNHDRFGPVPDKFGGNRDRQDNFGPNEDKFGPNNDRFGPPQDRFGPKNERFGPGVNRDRFGPNKDNFGSNDNRFGPNQDRPGPNQDRFAPNQNRFGPNQDRGGPQRGDFRGDGRFPGPKGDQNYNQESFDDREQNFEDYDYDSVAANFEQDENAPQEEEEAWNEEPDFYQTEAEPEPEAPPPPETKEEIFQATTVIDYDHKSFKETEPEVLIEPIYMFDYRHKPISRIPLSQRPKWLSETVKNIREFDPPVVRPYEIRRYPPPQDNWRNDRYQDNWQPHGRRGYEERSSSYEDRRPRNYDEQRGSKNDWNSQKWEEKRSYKEDKNFHLEERRHNIELEEEKISDTEWPEDDEEEPIQQQPTSSSDFPLFPKKEETQMSFSKNVVLIEDLINPPGRYKRPPRIVIILRGPPGSGKTFLAKLIKDKEVEGGGSAPRILSLDDYFMVEQEKEVTEEGKKVKVKEMIYEYEAEMEESYRTSLIKSFKKTITDGYFSFIIVDNVNDKVKYFGEMWSFAKQNGFQVYICQLELDVQTCSRRNIHGRSEADIEACVANWEPTPSHHPTLDATSLLQSASIPEVEMEEVNSPESDLPDHEGSEDQVARSKWDNFDCSVDNLAKLDGVNKPLRQRTMEEYLQLDTQWTPVKPTKPGQKRVRWADLEEQKQQEKMRAIGFVVGHTNWDRMMDPTGGSSALTQTKYIERTGRYKVDQK